MARNVKGFQESVKTVTVTRHLKYLDDGKGRLSADQAGWSSNAASVLSFHCTVPVTGPAGRPPPPVQAQD